MRPQPVQIHGTPCVLQPAQAGGYTVARQDTGAVVTQQPTRFLAVARAAVALHTPELKRSET